MRNQSHLAPSVFIIACVIGGVALAQQQPSARPAARPQEAPSQVSPSPSPAARSVLENMEITPEGGVNFYTTFNGKRMRSLAISPQGSLIAGGVSYGAKTPLTNDPPTLNPVEYDKAGAGGGRNWVHDFYFGRFMHGEGQPRLYSRGVFLWGRGDSPDIQLGRTGPDNAKTTYGPQEDTEPGTSLGKIVFVNWGEGEFQGDLAGITARNDTVATKTKNPGSLHFHTAGQTTFKDPKKAARAWRDGPERMVIRSNGYVGIGDEPSPAERLHVFGNIRAEGTIIAKGTKKFEIDHPTRPGKKLVHAAIEGPEAAVYYRGEARLVDGQTVISLPEYFEALTAPQGRTITLTNLDGFDRLAVQSQAGVPINDGRFVVVSENSQSAQRFFWEVKAVRADVGPLQTEP
jgi:hypothetical protein